VVGNLWHRQLVRLRPFQPLSGPDTQVQLQLTVNPVHALVVPSKALHVAQIQKAQAKASSLAVGRQTHQPFHDLGALIVKLSFIAIARLADLKPAVRQRDADSLGIHRMHGHLPSLRWPYRFFPRASFSKSFCMLISAYIRFRRRFSASIVFNYDTIEASIPHTSHATCKSSRCSFHVLGKTRKPAHRFPPASKSP
jgi:hypothetical protein